MGGLVLKIVDAAASAAFGEPRPGWVELVDTAGTLAIILVVAYVLARGLGWMRRRLLWRVRRKLILSYVFVGLVPSLLIVTFFVLAGLLLIRNVAGYMVQTRLEAQATQARFLAQTVLVDVDRAASAAAVRDTLERLQESASTRYPFLSIAVVPVDGVTCAEGLVAAGAGRTPPLPLPVSAGAWAHLPAPTSLPAWITTCDGVAQLTAYDAADAAQRSTGATDLRLVARAVALPATRTPTWAVVLDLPISAVVEQRLQEETGIQLGAIGDLRTDESPAVAARGTALDARPAPDYGVGLVSQALRRWVVLVQHVDWASGARGDLNVMLSLHLVDIYRRIAFGSGLGSAFSGVLLGALVVVGVLFLLIQGVALVLGLALARQITGAVHDLFTGTEHLRNRDFTHVIPVRARDQLGELADSFNVMTGEITRLLSDVARKERLEQEFATAREIQMKLLPQGPLTVPGLAVSAYCEPAREVGGDYYDVFPVDEDVFGFLIADVSGKGVGAGLYMAQLKGTVLSLARQHRSPRDLLVAVNRVLVDHLDGKSFITMSYLVVDLRRQVMTYARAGHCPMIVAPGVRGGVRPPIKVLAPDGLVVGLSIGDSSLFESLLEEVTVPLAPGDLFMLFTDGMSEMMNLAHDCFGETRLGELAGEHRDLPLDQLADRLVAEVRAFGAGADQHDDMTMLLLRVEPAGHAAAPVAVAAAVEA
ncbi:MAG: SpoIIE family protein phosphatase [Acidobacteria bacterium]|nr:SpoIIE family protein phosphatase [Acidobacteriota bacterium]